MPEEASSNPLQNVGPSSWDKLSKTKIYFGHQSVGFNIIDGIKDLMKENSQIKLNIVETSNPEDFNKPLFAHSRVGKNRDLESKLHAFARFLEGGIGDKADIAFFKFCYVDIGAKTNVEDIFHQYTDTMSHLKHKYPKTIFVHTSVPVKTTKITFNFRLWLKSLVKADWRHKIYWLKNMPNSFSYDDNIKRNEFNELLRKEYEGKDPVFDLAELESVFPNGKQSTFTENGKTYSSMVPDYTYDGGHLNETGRRIVAEQLLLLLATLSG